MENATRALTMAASVLIALVIISAILLVFNNLSSYQKVNQELQKNAQVIEFNSQFDTYDRTDVRGSDLLSLINKVVDYNERQSSIGNEGSELGYKPIKLIINIKNNKENMKVPNSDVNGLQLFKRDEYEIKENIVTGNYKIEILDKINDIENDSTIDLNKSDFTKLAVGISSIFLNGSDLENTVTKDTARRQYNNITGKNISTYDESLKPNGKIRNAVYKYYEFIQFKRTYFDCISLDGKSTGIIYDNNTGRITEMSFVGNGRIE